MPNHDSPAVIWWIRRDLRLADNLALTEATRQARSVGGWVLPLFILDDALQSSARVAQKRLAFLHASLESLGADLRAKGSALVVRQGEPLACLQSLFALLDVIAIHAESDVSAYALKRDTSVAQALPLVLHEGLSIRDTAEVRTETGGAFARFSSFARRWKELPPPRLPLPAPETIPASPQIGALVAENPSMPTSEWNPQEQGWEIGKKAALQTLDGFSASYGKGGAIASYARERNYPALSGTLRLSPYLHLGVISPHECAARALAILEQPGEGDLHSGASAWLDELIWRDFFLHATLHTNSRPLVSAAVQSPQREWRDAPEDFAAWAEGNTGYPLVDAAMRELRATGWMHNRCRMVVASFLVKHLLIDWRLGERYFMQQLIDGDVAANLGNWKWVAGVGVDAAPWFRMMNPTLQAQRFDPDSAYIRRWLPELARLPLKFQVEPFRIQPEEERQFDFHLGVDYPRPLIEHEFARARALRK